jgi:hypothetical protein
LFLKEIIKLFRSSGISSTLAKIPLEKQEYDKSSKSNLSSAYRGYLNIISGLSLSELFSKFFFGFGCGGEFGAFISFFSLI